jgi:hypothetical protein
MRRLSVLACLSAVFAACHGDSTGDLASITPVSTSLGLAIEGLSGFGDLWVVVVPEAGQGGSDLNGDGDALDRVAHMLDLATGVLTNTSLAIPPTTREPLGPVNALRAVLMVSEADQGASDLNGDGDTNDLVPHVYEAATGTATSLGIAARLWPPYVVDPMFQNEGGVAFSVLEEEDGRDLDGDAIVEPFVRTLHLYDPRHGLMNVGANSTIEPVLHAGFLGLTVEETTIDLDGDGDTNDPRVLHFFELATRTLSSAGVDLGPQDLVAGGGVFVVAVSEFTSGFQDLNFDGDKSDDVFRAIDPLSGVHAELGYSASFPDLFTAVASSAGRIVFGAGEVDGIDRNGDGDFSDILAIVFEPASGRLMETDLEVHYTTHLTLVGEHLVVPVDEAGPGIDLNGDGDALDKVLHTFDLADGRRRNLRLVAFGGLVDNEDLLVATVFEDFQGEDLDGDGDLGEAVPFLWDARSGRLTNTRQSTSGVSILGSSRRVLFLGREELSSTFRFEYLLHDARTGRTHPLGLEPSFDSLAGMGATRAVIGSSEARLGADQNEDGDLDDDVLFLVE